MIGRSIAQYQILEKIGAGGMGEIYKAQDSRLNRMVAIKVLPTAAASDVDRRRRFVQEAQAASALNHPNIITIHDILSDESAEYMVMEFVTGKTLAELIPHGGLGMAKTLQYGVQIADGLAAAHAAGIIHRDLKPGNVMVTEAGLCKILDFGLAKMSIAARLTEETQTMGSAPMTVAGSILGTVAYMSPEQAEGKRLDARSDIFSFGVVFYEMLTGTKAFSGDSAISTMSAILRDEVKPASQLVAGVPPEVDEIIMLALRKDPADRWQSMQVVHKVLNTERLKFDSGSFYSTSFSRPAPPPMQSIPPMSQAPAPPAPPAPARNPRRKRLVWVAIGLAMLWWFTRRPGRESPPRVVVQAPAVSIGDSAEPDEDAKAGNVLTNRSVLEMSRAHVPDAVIIGQIRAAKTRFDLSTSQIIRLTKAGVSPAVLEAMRDPAHAGKPTVPREPPPPAPAAADTPAPVPPPPSPAVPTSTVNVVLFGNLPFPITLTEDVPLDAEAGRALHFQAAKEFRIGSSVVIPQGAAVTGEVTAGRKGAPGHGGKASFRLIEAEGVGGVKIKVRAHPGGRAEGNIAPPGYRGKDVLAPSGSTYLAFIDGTQTVTVNK